MLLTWPIASMSPHRIGLARRVNEQSRFLRHGWSSAARVIAGNSRGHEHATIAVLRALYNSTLPIEPRGQVRARGVHRAARSHGIRRRDRRRRPVRARRGDPPEAARRGNGPRSLGLRAGEGFRARRAHPVGRGHGSARAERTAARLEGAGRAARHTGHRGPLLPAHEVEGDLQPALAAAGLLHQRRLLRREPRQRRPLAGARGRGARDRDLRRIRGRRGPLRRSGCGARGRNRRHGRRQERRAHCPVPARRRARGKVHPVRGRRRGHLGKEVIARYRLDDGRDPQT